MKKPKIIKKRKTAKDLPLDLYRQITTMESRLKGKDRDTSHYWEIRDTIGDTPQYLSLKNHGPEHYMDPSFTTANKIMNGRDIINPKDNYDFTTIRKREQELYKAIHGG